MLSIISFFTWVITAPRSLSFLNPHVQKELNSISPKFNVTITDSLIKWDNIDKAFVLEIQDVGIHSDKDQALATFPKISFDFSVIRFLAGNIISSDLTLINPSFYLDTSREGIYMAADDSGQQTRLLETIFANLKAQNFSYPISSIRTRNAEIFINNGISEFVWNIKDGYARIESSDKIISEMNINFGKDEAYLGAEISYSDGENIDTALKFRGVPSYIYSDIFPKVKFVRNINVVSDGSFNFLMSEQGEISQFKFKFDKVAGNINFPEYFDKQIDISNIMASGDLYNNFTVMTLDSLSAQLKDTKAYLSGSFRNTASFPEIAPDINADIKVENLPINKLAKYWPVNFGNKSRKWIINNVTGGNIAEAKGHFELTAKDFALLKEWKKSKKSGKSPLPDKAINAEIKVTGTKVNYHKEYPDISGVDAVIKFTSKNMVVEASKGRMLSSLINRAVVEIPDMWRRPLKVNIEGEYVGKSQDAAKILQSALRAKKVNPIVESIYNSTGNVGGKISLSIPIKKDLRYKEIKIDMSSRFSQNTIPKFLNGQDLNNAAFDLKLKNNKIFIDGNASILDKELLVNYQYDTNNNNADYTLNGNISAEELSALGIATIPFIDNNFNTDVKIKKRGDITFINGKVDITDSVVKIPQIGFSKEEGASGSVVFTATEQYNIVEVKRFSVNGDKYSASGKFTVNKGQLIELDLEDAKFDYSDFSATYGFRKNTHNLNISGRELDLSKVQFSEHMKKDNSKKTALNIAAKLNQINMKNGEKLTDFTANINCSTSICSSVNLFAKTRDSGFVALSMKPLGDRSSLMLESDNAGALINSLGISKHIKGGRITVESTFVNDDRKLAQGFIQILDFTAIKTPILGKMLTLASLKGISDLLNNKGIQFEKFSAPFHMSDGVITVKDAKTAGSSIGITANGTVDFKTDHIDLNGAIVPAYEVNKFIEDIPVIGNLLVGKKNEGFIATKYRIKGPYENAKITVNPLTILTPGFLRNIFDIF